MRINTKQTGDSLTATEFNQIPYEVQNAITNAGVTPSATVLTQLSQAISQMVTDANFFSTSGTESNIILTANAPRIAPTRLTDGMMVRFRALYTNGANTTVNLNNLGAKNVQIDGENISVGEFEEGKTYILTYVQSTDTFELFQSGGGGAGLEIGDIGIAFLGINESDNKRRYLNGQVIMQSEFEAFTLWVKEKIELYPNAVCSEDEWQNEVQTSVFHQCGKVVINDEDGTIRLPKVVNIQGCQDLANNLGVRLPESLPNIKGFYSSLGGGEGLTSRTGAFASTQNYPWAYGHYTVPSSPLARLDVNFNANSSSSTYQDNAPVQQEAIQYPFYIQVAKGGKRSVDATEEYTINNPFSLFDSKYDTKDISNVSWLNASTGNMHDGTLYPSAYEEILRAYNSTKKIGNADVKGIDEAYTDYDFRIDTVNQEFRLPKLNGEENIIDYSTAQALGVSASFVAPYNGCIRNIVTNTSGVSNCTINGISVLEHCSNAGTYKNSTLCLVKKGDVYKSNFVNDASFFYKAKGNGNLYYYVGETVENPNLINAGQVMNALSKKVDLPTATASSFPSNRYINLQLGASGTTYTAPANGWVYVSATSNDNSFCSVLLDNLLDVTSNITKVASRTAYYGSAGSGIYTYVPVLKGDIVRLSYLRSTITFFRFIYAQGE